MAYVTPDLAVTGNFITAADGNRRRDNDEYLKGNAGAISFGNSGTFSGNVTATATVTGTVGVVTGPSAGAQFSFFDRVDSTQWVLYASSGVMWFYNPVLGNFFGFNYSNGQLNVRDAVANGGPSFHAGLLPGYLSQAALTGFLRSGTWTYGYSGELLVSQVMNALGPLNGWAITYEYSGTTLVAQRLRIGGAGGTVIQSIGYGYDGLGRILTEGHS